jgi:pilus assembly protein Flp/PilA
MLRKLFKNKQGQGLVEYALLIAGVALICAVGVSIFGHKTSDLIDAVAVVLPGAHQGDNGPITSGHLIETTAGATGSPIQLDLNGIVTASGTGRLGGNVGGSSGNANGFGGLVTESGS